MFCKKGRQRKIGVVAHIHSVGVMVMCTQQTDRGIAAGIPEPQLVAIGPALKYELDQAHITAIIPLGMQERVGPQQDLPRNLRPVVNIRKVRKAPKGELCNPQDQPRFLKGYV